MIVVKTVVGITHLYEKNCYCMPSWVDLKRGNGIDHHRQGTALNFGS